MEIGLQKGNNTIEKPQNINLTPEYQQQDDNHVHHIKQLEEPLLDKDIVSPHESSVQKESTTLLNLSFTTDSLSEQNSPEDTLFVTPTQENKGSSTDKQQTQQISCSSSKIIV